MNPYRTIYLCTETEFKKIISQKKYRLILFIIGLLPIAFTLIQTLPNSMMKFTIENFPYTILSIASYVLIPLLTFMLASDLFAGEHERHELKILLTKPVNRIFISFGKLCSMMVYHLLILIILFTISYIISILFIGMGNVNFQTVLSAYGLTLLPVLTICTLAALVSTFTHSSTTSLFVGLLIYIGTVVIGLVFSGIAPALFTNYSSIFKMVIGSSILVPHLLFGISILVGYAMIFMSAQVMLFENKEC